MTQTFYVVLTSLVEHLLNDDGIITDRTAFKRIAVRCGDLLSPLDFEVMANNGDIDLNETTILID